MLSCQDFMILLVTLNVLLAAQQSCWAKPAAEAMTDPTADAAQNKLPKLLLITDDVIPDVIEKDNKKVIRVNPLDLPPIKEDPNALNMDSSLYKIQTIKPYAGQRKYVNMQRSKPQTADVTASASTNTPIFRRLPLSGFEKPLKPKHLPKKKNLHFLYNQEDLNGNLLSKTMRVHVAPGAYPVYYVISKNNGRFGKTPLKSFDSPQAFMKYLKKNKLEDLPALETYDEV